MRAEERLDGVALPVSRFGDLGGGRIVFPPQKLLPCRLCEAWISSWTPRLLPSSSCPAGSGAVGVFTVRESLSVCDLWSDSAKFSMYSNTSQFFENPKPGWMLGKTRAQNSRREEAGRCAGS
jgi:hypothetical protein